MNKPESRPKVDFMRVPEILWAEDIADLLGVRVVQARRLMRSGKIPAKRLGRRWFCLRDELLRTLRP